MRTTLTLLMLTLLASLSFAQDAATRPVELRGRIDSVTVYRGQALVTRLIDLPAAGGLREIVVSDLPPQVQPNSLMAESPDAVEVRSVQFRQRAVAQDVRDEVRKFDEQIRELQDQQAVNQRTLQTLAEQRDYLNKLANFVAPTAQAEMNKGVLNAETLEKVTTFQFNQRQAIALQELKLQKDARDLAERLAVLQRQRGEVAGGSARTVREAVVFAKLPAQATTLRVRYLVSNATWFPSYNIRGERGAKDVKLEYNASIQQLSGEDWGDVQMTLSTATPNLIAMAPSLEPLAISLTAAPNVLPVVVYREQAKQLEEQRRNFNDLRNTGNRADGTSLSINGSMMNPAQSGAGKGAAGQQFDYAANKEAMDEGLQQVARDLQVLELVAKDARDGKPTRGNEETVSVTYQIANRTSLPSRQDVQLIQVASMPVAAEFYKLAAPVMSQYVYDQATLTNNGKMVLLAGPVASYLSGEFVGSGQLPTVAVGEAFDVGFGIDSALRASRELLAKTETTQGGNKVMNFTYRLTVENFGTAAAAVRLVDRLPITKENELRITLASTDKAKSPQHDAKKGMLRWDVPVEAQAIDTKAVAVEYQYKLEFDKQMTIAGLPVSGKK